MKHALLPAGRLAVLVEVEDLDAVLAADAALRPLVETGEGVWGSVLDVVPAARTVLVSVASADALAGVRDRVREIVEATDAAAVPDPGDHVVEVPVHYDGPDLEDVARLTGLGVDEVVAAHTGMPWRVAFGGFAPGFAYLVGGDPRLEVARRESPRTKVPAGAVGLAGEFSGVYPRESPGGWQLLGHTDIPLWDVDRDPPALLRPGWSVRFTDAGGSS